MFTIWVSVVCHTFQIKSSQDGQCLLHAGGCRAAAGGRSVHWDGCLEAHLTAEPSPSSQMQRCGAWLDTSWPPQGFVLYCVLNNVFGPMVHNRHVLCYAPTLLIEGNQTFELCCTPHVFVVFSAITFSLYGYLK